MSKMIPKNLREIMIHNAQEVQNQLAKDHEPVVKLYSKYGKVVWLLSEIDSTNDIAFGVCDLGQGKPELGYVSITDLERLKHARLKVPMVEIDPNFQGAYPLSVYWEAAKTAGRAVEEDALLKEAQERLKKNK